jgi:[acyl-carrier-protein] S-malonyltransferase
MKYKQKFYPRRLSMAGMAFLFPGQGSQYVGMGKEIHDQYPVAREVFGRAEGLLDLPLRKLCFEGPLEELTLTRNLQPAVTAVNLAILAVLEELGFGPTAVAGHSLGEYSALYAAGVLSLDDTLKLVKTRGALMDQAAQKYPGAMAAVMGLSAEKLDALLAGLHSRGAIGPANFNTPEQTVISGSKELVEEASRLAAEQGAKAVPLAVSGAWHSPLMQEALEAFQQVLAPVVFQAPRCPVCLNVTGQSEQDPGKIKDIMGRQIGSSVRWVQIVQALQENGYTRFVEVGPKKVLLGLVRKCLPREFNYTAANVEDLKSLQAFMAAQTQ